MEKYEFRYTELKWEVENALKKIRHFLIIPYIRGNEEAKSLGYFIGPNEEFAERYPGEWSDQFFPMDANRKLISYFDSTRYLVLNDKTTLENYSVIAEEKELDECFERMDELIVPYSNWRGNCFEYLKATLVNPAKAAIRFLDDKNPWIFWSAITALSTVQGEDEKEYDRLMGEYFKILKAWDEFHA